MRRLTADRLTCPCLLQACAILFMASMPAIAAVERARYFFDQRYLVPAYTQAAWLTLADYRSAAPRDTAALALWCEVNVELGDDSQQKAEKERYYGIAETAADSLRALCPSSASGCFWWAAARGDYALAQGIPEAMIVLPSVIHEMEHALALDSGFVLPYAILGIVFRELPSVTGGDWIRSRRYFETGLRQSPDFTLLRLELARLDIKEGLYGQARNELDRLLSTQQPYMRAAFVLNDRPAAESLLAQLRGR